jgi:hypothetical protein
MSSHAHSSTASSSGLPRLAWCTSLAVVVLLLTACAQRFVVAPDSPSLILQGRGSVLLGHWDGTQFVQTGWVDAESLAGQTVVKYDWTEKP